MKLKCIVVDDEVEAIEEIAEYITTTPKLQLTATFSKPVEALEYIKDQGNFDIVFMDVDMPLLNGVELSKLIRPFTEKLVFTTSHARYALDAFEVLADAFLLKPYSYTTFLSTVSRFFQIKDEISKNVPAEEFIFVKSKLEDLRMVKIRFADIIAVESVGNYVKIYTPDAKIVTHLKLKEAKEILRPYSNFIQLHRSFIISKNHINAIEGNILIMSNGYKFSIGENYKTDLNDYLTNKSLKSVFKRY